MNTKLSRGGALTTEHTSETDIAAEETAGREIDLDDSDFYLNRELSLLQFQRRVLEQAHDESIPLLERVKFLAILSSNLAEFFMVRIAGLRQQVAAGVSELSTDGRTPAEQLEEARAQAHEIIRAGRVIYVQLVAELEAEGIFIKRYDELEESQRRVADEYFDDNVFPVLTPLAFDPGRPFPHISNLSLNLAVLVRDTEGTERFARVKIPPALPRFIPIPAPAERGIPRQEEEEPRAAPPAPRRPHLGPSAGPVLRHGRGGGAPLQGDARCRAGYPGDRG